MKATYRTACIAAGIALAGGLALVGAVGANAATLYDHDNYHGASYSARRTPDIGNMNDRASSIRAWGTYIYYEDAKYSGRALRLSGDYNCLRAISSEDMYWFESWNDRISSFR